MLYFRLKDGVVVEVAKDSLTAEQRAQGYAANRKTIGNDGWISRGDFPDFDFAAGIAASAELQLGGKYLPTDNGPHVSPRYDVIAAPKLGEPVSRGFNGDYYPAGTITKISDSYRRVETDDGTVFWRRKQTGGWKAGGVWWMVAGHRSELNPHF